MPTPPTLGWSRGGGADRFAVHAVAGRSVVVEIFEVGAGTPLRVLALERQLERNQFPDPFQVWQGQLESSRLPECFEYLLRVDGGPPLLDPYATLLTGGEEWGRSDDTQSPGVGRRYRCLAEPSFPSMEPLSLAPPRPKASPAARVLYELHVRGFTRHESSGVKDPGTFLGLIEKIPYLVELGVTTVELMPVFEFDETENSRRDPTTGERLLNFWGYSPVSFFAPKAGYAADPAPGAAAGELRLLVSECHRAGLEVVLDVVYNHTAEGGGGATDPLHSWRGLDARGYYLTEAASGRALDLTGCGNTVSAHAPVARRMILDSLRHWVTAYGVDGFRFDLASVFFRGETGEILERSPIAEEIAADPLLRDRLLIAEPWDATGFSPPRGFPEPWLEWDGELRDSLRRFVGGLEREPRALARRLAGVGPQGGRLPAARAVRFAACHDGRPLADVPAWERKHNEANGEGNRDGWSGEVAWNGGVEGPSDDPALLDRRAREVRAMLALLTAAPGTIQLTAGDEFGRTQKGNTNAWCRDDEIGWVLWPDPSFERSRAPTAPLARYVRQLLSIRKKRPGDDAESHEHDASGSRAERRNPDDASASSEAGSPRTSLIEPFNGSLSLSGGIAQGFALLRVGIGEETSCLVAANSGSVELRFPLPVAPSGRGWRLRVDSGTSEALAARSDDEAPFLARETTELRAAPRSVRILVAEGDSSGGLDS